MTPGRATESGRKVFLIATEESGDRLGAALMKVLRQRLGGAVRFEGVGGRAMAREGLDSLFPIEELSIIGLAAVVKQLPKILRLIRQTAAAATEAAPDVLVITESLPIPVIGIGAGPGCSGQVLVLHDMLGVTRGKLPRFVRNFMAGADSIESAVRAYVAAVKDGSFPDPAVHGY